MRQLLLASHNEHKISELRRMLPAARIAVVGLGEVSAAEPPAETGASFEQNALIKARAAHRSTGLPTLADDSGLAVEVLNGMPGVRSARWAGPDATDQENYQLLLRQLADVAEPQRMARFVCALAYVRLSPTGEYLEDVVIGQLPGSISQAASGAQGFGYDPVFRAEGHTMTVAELAPADKDAISHRARALDLMLPMVIDELAGAQES